MIAKIKQKTTQFLRWTEKWTHTDMVYLAKGGFWTTASRVVGSLLAFALSIAFANLLPKEAYGTYKFILSVAGILSITTLPGIDTALVKTIAQGIDGDLEKALWTKIRWGFIGSAAGLLLATYYYLNSNPVLALSIAIAACALPFAVSFNLYVYYLQGKKAFNVSAILSIIGQIMTSSALILALVISKNVIIITFAYYIATVIMNINCWIIAKKKTPPKNRQCGDTIKFGKALSFSDAIIMIAGNLDKILMWHFLGATQLAIYTIALAPVNQISSFFRSITTVAFPKIAGSNAEVVKKTLPVKIIIFLILLSSVILFYFILVPYLYSLFFPAYSSSIPYTRMYVFSLLFIPQSIASIAILSHGNHKATYLIRTLTPFSKITLLILLLPFYGITGAIIAQYFSLIINLITIYYYYRKI